MCIQTGAPCKWTNDSQRFLLEHFDTIWNSPSQIYHYALPFCPSSSWLQKYYSSQLSQVVKVVKGTSAKWGACSRTVTIDGIPRVLSYRNNTIAVGLGLDSDNIIILDATTGSQTAVFPGHTDWVRSLVFSLDGRLLVSGSDDKTVKLWDVQTGGVVKTFHGHTLYVTSVSISADCTRIASGSFDKTICLWSTETGECHYSIKLQKWVDRVAFSPTNPGLLISISGNKVQQWDIGGSQTGFTYNASHIAFSPNHTQFALCHGSAITVQDFDSGAILVEFYLSNDCCPEYCCFSPDGSLVAVASKTIAYVWSVANPVPHLVATFADHIDDITSLVFLSPSSLTSASLDRSVKFWQIGVSSTDQVATDSKSTQTTSVPIEFVSLQAKEGIVISGDSNGMVSIWDISTGLWKTSFQTPAKDNFWGDARLIDDRLLLVWGWKDKIRIWDSERGEFPQTLNSIESLGLRISGDGFKVFNVDWDGSVSRIQAWSMWTWEPAGEVELEGGKKYYLDSFHADGSRVWVQSDLITKGWDFNISNSTPIPLSNLSSERPYLDFIDGASFENGPPVVKNTAARKEVFRLSGKYVRPYSAWWDGQYLVAGYEDGEVLILDFHHLCPQ